MNILYILIPIFIVVVIYYFFKKRKNKSSSGPVEVKKRRDGDEVWRTIKDWLRDNGEKGKEVVESYVAKRYDPNLINRTLPKEDQKKQKEEIKKRKREKKQSIKEAKKNKTYKKPKSEAPKEFYVILFVTRSPKTKIEDEPRAIECEVKQVVVGKRKTERKITILGERDYKTEAEWILPIKKAEEKKVKKEYTKQQRRKKLNFFKKFKKDKELTPKQEEKIKNKELKKAQKNELKKQKENAKWEKKETVVKTKK